MKVSFSLRVSLSESVCTSVYVCKHVCVHETEKERAHSLKIQHLQTVVKEKPLNHRKRRVWVTR